MICPADFDGSLRESRANAGIRHAQQIVVCKRSFTKRGLYILTVYYLVLREWWHPPELSYKRTQFEQQLSIPDAVIEY